MSPTKAIYWFVVSFVVLNACRGAAIAEGSDGIVVLAFGDSTTAPRNVGESLSGRPSTRSSQGEVSEDPTTAPHNVVNVVTAPSPCLYIYCDILRTELPNRGVRLKGVDNEGVGGDRTDLGLARLTRDLGAKSPDYVIVQFGINDSWWDEGEPGDVDNPDSSGSRVPIDSTAQSGGDGIFDNGNDHRFTSRGNYSQNLTKIVDELQRTKATVILMTPNQVSSAAGASWRNELLGKYAGRVRSVANEKRTRLVDVWKLYGDYSARPGNNMDDLLLDGVHPNAQGHRLVADALMNVVSTTTRKHP